MRWKRVDNVQKKKIEFDEPTSLIQKEPIKKEEDSILKEMFGNIKLSIKEKFNRIFNKEEKQSKASFYHIETKRQLNSKKVIMLSASILVAIVIIVGTICMISANNKKQKEQEEYRAEVQRIREEEEIKRQQEEAKKEEERQAKLPKLTQEGVENMENIYFADRRRVFLTFDDGPSSNTGPILDILQQEGVKATFFELGTRVEAQPDMVKRAYDEGHYIASHGYSHVYSQIYSSARTVLDEYNQCVQAIRNAIGESEYEPHLFRFPGGFPGGPYTAVKTQAREILLENGILNIDWNALSGDAEGNNFPVETLMARTNETVGSKNNVVLLMHDSQAKTTTVEALPQIIAYFRDRGYEFTNFYEVIK